MTDVLARTIYGEARGELYGGRVAIGCVVRNRVNIDINEDGKPDWWGEGYDAVCMKPFQFSCWNMNDPNLEKVKAVTAENAIFGECLEIASAIVSGWLPDVTLGATHYKHKDLPWPRDWGQVRTPIINIGRHTFYNLME